MSFTTRTITHSFTNADGTPASGKVEWALAGRMTNGTTTIVPSSMDAPLDATGAMSVAVTANDDNGTVPLGEQWEVTLRILGMAPLSFFVSVPNGSGTVDLGSLLPAVPQVT